MEYEWRWLNSVHMSMGGILLLLMVVDPTFEPLGLLSVSYESQIVFLQRRSQIFILFFVFIGVL